MPYKAREDGHILIVGDARLKYLRLFNFFAKPLLSYIITEALDMKKGGKKQWKRALCFTQSEPAQKWITNSTIKASRVLEIALGWQCRDSFIIGNYYENNERQFELKLHFGNKYLDTDRLRLCTQCVLYLRKQHLSVRCPNTLTPSKCRV